MEMQAEAERKKRAQVLESEGIDVGFFILFFYIYNLVLLDFRSISILLTRR